MIQYLSHSFNFDHLTGGLKLTLTVKNTDTQTAHFFIQREDDNSETLLSKRKFSVGPNTTLTVYYIDYTAAPSKLTTYLLADVLTNGSLIDEEGIKLSDLNGIKLLTTDMVDANADCVFAIDDLLLSDNYRVFNVKYNPDISSMKIITGDSITQTLGSQYPYFRRNGNMRYKQFNIGGLISYRDNEAFFADFKIGNLVDYDAERVKEAQFREAVLDFLYDSKPKIFKSATEGCMIIKLTNVSLTPNKQLGRMIYSFTAQATEYAAATIDNLVRYGKSFEGMIKS